MKLCIEQSVGRKHANPSKIWTLARWSKLVFTMVDVEESCCILINNVWYSFMIFTVEHNMENDQIFIFLRISSLLFAPIQLTSRTLGGVWVNVKNNCTLITTCFLWKTRVEDCSMFVLLNLSCAFAIFNISITRLCFNAKKKSLTTFYNVVKNWYEAPYLFFCLQIFILKKLNNMVSTYTHDVLKYKSWVRSQSNEPIVMKDSRTVELFVVIFTFS